MHLDLRFKNHDCESDFKKSSQSCMVCISALVSLCSLSNSLFAFSVPVGSNSVPAPLDRGRLPLNLIACTILALCSLRHCRSVTMDWVDFEILALVSLLCLAWSILLLWSILHAYALATLSLTSGIFFPIRSCRSWIFPCGILALHLIYAPSRHDDIAFVSIVGILSHFGFRLQERLLRVAWHAKTKAMWADQNNPETVGASPQAFLEEFGFDEVRPVDDLVTELRSNSTDWSGAEVVTDLRSNSTTRSTPGITTMVGKSRTACKTGVPIWSRTDSPAASSTSSVDVNVMTARPATSSTTPISSEAPLIRIFGTSSKRPAPCGVASLFDAIGLPRPSPTASSGASSLSRCPSAKHSRHSSSSDGVKSGSENSSVLFSDISFCAFSLSDSEKSFSRRVAPSDEVDDEQASGHPAWETCLQEWCAAFAACRYVSALTSGVSLHAADARVSELQQEIASVRELGEWKARKAAVAEQQHYAAKLCELRARGVVKADRNHGRRSPMTNAYDADGHWEVFEYDRLPDLYLQSFVISGQRLIDGCGKSCKLQCILLFEGRELRMDGPYLVRVGNHGVLRYRRKSSTRESDQD